jgi:hypothetical protein
MLRGVLLVMTDGAILKLMGWGFIVGEITMAQLFSSTLNLTHGLAHSTPIQLQH